MLIFSNQIGAQRATSQALEYDELSCCHVFSDRCDI
jgi:hypothetical protein